MEAHFKIWNRGECICARNPYLSRRLHRKNLFLFLCSYCQAYVLASLGPTKRDCEASRAKFFAERSSTPLGLSVVHSAVFPDKPVSLQSTEHIWLSLNMW